MASKFTVQLQLLLCVSMCVLVCVIREIAYQGQKKAMISYEPRTPLSLLKCFFFSGNLKGQCDEVHVPIFFPLWNSGAPDLKGVNWNSRELTSK